MARVSAYFADVARAASAVQNEPQPVARAAPAVQNEPQPVARAAPAVLSAPPNEPRPGRHAPLTLYAVLAEDATGQLHVGRTTLDKNSFPSLAGQFPQIQLFEREIAEQYALRPEGHPWLKPVRYHAPYGKGAAPWGDVAPPVGTGELYRVEGEEVHEVAVGPVHAGIIEPGHFRFQCFGEEVFHLEIALGYQHRGIEPAMAGGPNARSLHLMETLAGDTSIGHATAYCQGIEALTQTQVPARRRPCAVALELERLANHTGDLGALAGDVGFLPTMSYCGRIRGDWLNMTALLCGNRFGRSLVRPGGVAFDLNAAATQQLSERLEKAWRDVESAVNLLWETPSVMGRFEDTGHVSPEIARQIGLVGPAARACGVNLDIRRDFPFGIFRFSHIPVSTWHTGDVFARAYVRWMEIKQSVAFLREQLRLLPAGEVRATPAQPLPNRIAVSLVEGWRGEICHVAITDNRGQFRRYKVIDPSFHNWFGLAQSLRSQQISDFPLCNKSFNLSYCGHDL